MWFGENYESTSFAGMDSNLIINIPVYDIVATSFTYNGESYPSARHDYLISEEGKRREYTYSGSAGGHTRVVSTYDANNKNNFNLRI